ncbi:hypothetical protein ES332_D13G188300v1 [Gossypium tomentosum]|uniref:Uncharacterized protein n=1 Tax=Gossypium tomentosum TaxID=34277 RepID=A0A5D2HZ04_GOSTO|nr:hypothetical protein ES332_D13G188300v1 [Gossypium tomentosum]
MVEETKGPYHDAPPPVCLQEKNVCNISIHLHPTSHYQPVIAHFCPGPIIPKQNQINNRKPETQIRQPK